MAFEFKPGVYYLGMWYLELPEGAGNFMAMAFRAAKKRTQWTLQYRLRLYTGGGPFNHPTDPTRSKDDFRWYRAAYSGTEEKIFEAGQSFMQGIQKTLRTKTSLVDFLDLRGDCEKAMRIMADEKTCPHWMALKFMAQVPSEGHGE